MAEKHDALKSDKGQAATGQGVKSEEALSALRRLREIGEKLPTVDAAVIVREGRDLAEQDSRR